MTPEEGYENGLIPHGGCACGMLEASLVNHEAAG